MFPARPCRGSGTGGPPLHCGACRATGARQLIPGPPHPNKQHGDGQVYKWISSQKSLVFNSAPKQERKMSRRPGDTGSPRGPGAQACMPAPPLRASWAWGLRGGRAPWSATPARRLCPFTAIKGASSSKKNLNLVFENQYTALFQYKTVTLCRVSGPSGAPE